MADQADDVKRVIGALYRDEPREARQMPPREVIRLLLQLLSGAKSKIF